MSNKQSNSVPDFAFGATQNLKRPAAINESPGPQFDELLKRHKITKEEYTKIKSIMNRTPTLAELGVFSAMWSEHCSYKSSRVHLRRFPTTGPDVVVGPGENAGVVRLSGKLCVAFKMESHNHPSYIEPYQGAATGVGGILRDVFCMGSRPVANLNCLRFGVRSHKKTRHLVEHVVKGIGDYGNCVGIPTVGGNISFDDSYNGNCLVNAMTVGIIHEDKIFKGFASGVGNLVVYVGSATGRDGIHGATMASGSFSGDENQERSTVQVGDPFTEKLLLEATLEVLEKNLVIGIQDMGAAGLTSSSFEMAGRAGNGLFIDLDKVPTRTTAMTAYELMLSESQERMLMVIKPENWQPLRAVLEKWQLAHAVIGAVTSTGRVEAVRHGVLEIDMPVEPLTDEAPKYNRPMIPIGQRTVQHSLFSSHDLQVAREINSENAASLLSDMLREVGTKEPIYRQYDHHIGSSTVFSSEHQGAALLWMRSDWSEPADQYLGLAIATNCNERFTAVDAHIGSALAVAKCARMIAATGAKPIAITDCLNFGNPEDPVVMRQFSDAVDGISEACRELGVPVVSGNVSLYNETDGVSIKPTPMIGMVGRHSDIRKAVPAVLSDQGGDLYLLAHHDSTPAYGGSLVAQTLGLTRNPNEQRLPKPIWSHEIQAMSAIGSLISSANILACRDIGAGGISVTAAKMLIAPKENQSIKAMEIVFDDRLVNQLRGFAGGRVGESLGLKEQSKINSLSLLFAEWSGAYLVQESRNGILANLKGGTLPDGFHLVKVGTVRASASGKSLVQLNSDSKTVLSDVRGPYGDALRF